jgi:hypothetical protein
MVSFGKEHDISKLPLAAISKNTCMENERQVQMSYGHS